MLLAVVACRPAAPPRENMIHPLLAKIPAGEAVFVFAAYRDRAPAGVKTLPLPAELSGQTADNDATEPAVAAAEARYLLLPDRAIFPMFGCAASLWERVESAKGLKDERVTLWRRRENVEWVSPAGPEPTAAAAIPDPDDASRPAFALEKTEVTYAQYAAFLNAVRPEEKDLASWIDLARPDNPLERSPQGYRVCADCAAHPVAFVSFRGAQAYCAHLNRALPETREWEIAACGSETRTYPWGETAPVERFANIAGEADGFAHSSPVGSFPQGASPFGLLDMAGNAFEWTVEQGAPALRGGSWATEAGWAACAAREVNVPLARNNHNGFRCRGRTP